ncbi:MAG: hypothetical protein V4489_04620 [Chlamydiota bacterium]
MSSPLIPPKQDPSLGIGVPSPDKKPSSLTTDKVKGLIAFKGGINGNSQQGGMNKSISSFEIDPEENLTKSDSSVLKKK